MADLWWYAERKCWCADVTHPRTGKRERWRFGPDETHARREFHLRMAALYGRELPDGPATTIGQLILAFLRDREATTAPATYRFYRTYLEWLAVSYPEMDAELLTVEHLDGLKVKHANRSPRAINAFVTACKTMYTWGCRRRLLRDNPIRYATGVPSAVPKKKAMPPADLERVFTLGDREAPLGDYCRLMYLTGMRPGEAAGLTWEDYDPKAGTIELRNHKTSRRTARTRLIPLSAEAVTVLERQPRHGEAVFATAEAAYEYQDFARLLRRLRGDTGLSDDDRRLLRRFSFHACRHSFVSNLRLRGVDEWTIQQLVGHASKLMTRYYSKPDVDALREAAERLGEHP